MDEILGRSRIQTWTKDGATEILITCSDRDFVALVRNRRDLPSALSLDKAKVTLSCDDRVTSFDVIGQRIVC